MSAISIDKIDDVTIAFENDDKIMFCKGKVNGCYEKQDNEGYILLDEMNVSHLEALTIAKDIEKVAEAIRDYQKNGQ